MGSLQYGMSCLGRGSFLKELQILCSFTNYKIVLQRDWVFFRKAGKKEVGREGGRKKGRKGKREIEREEGKKGREGKAREGMKEGREGGQTSQWV